MIPNQINEKIAFILAFYQLSITLYPNAAVVVNGYNECKFSNVHLISWSPTIIRILIIMKVILFALKQSS